MLKLIFCSMLFCIPKISLLGIVYSWLRVILSYGGILLPRWGINKLLKQKEEIRDKLCSSGTQIRKYDIDWKRFKHKKCSNILLVLPYTAIAVIFFFKIWLPLEIPWWHQHDRRNVGGYCQLHLARDTLVFYMI